MVSSGFTESEDRSADPSNIQHVVATSFTNFEKSKKFQEMFSALLGKGIFTTDGDEWKKHRATARPFFSRDRISDFKHFEHHAAIMCDILAGLAKSGQPFDLQVRRGSLACVVDSKH